MFGGIKRTSILGWAFLSLNSGLGLYPKFIQNKRFCPAEEHIQLLHSSRMSPRIFLVSATFFRSISNGILFKFFHLSVCGFGAPYAIKSLHLKLNLALAHNNKVAQSLNDLKPGALEAISVV